MKLLVTRACGHYAYTRETTGSRTSVQKAVAAAQTSPCLECRAGVPTEWWDFEDWERQCDCHGCDCCCCSLCCTGYCRRDEGIDPDYVRIYAEAGILVEHWCRPERWYDAHPEGWECVSCGIWKRA